MNKLIISVLLAALLMGLSGCTQEGATGEALRATGGTVPSAPAPTPITDSITFSEYMVSGPSGPGSPEFYEVMDHNELDYLTNWPSKSYTVNGVTYYSAMNERIIVEGFDTFFDPITNMEVVTEFGSGQYKYNLNFSNGLPEDFVKGDGNSIQVPFLYETCDVLEINRFSGMVKLKGLVSGKTYTMYDSQGFPYDPSTPPDEYDWKARLIFSGGKLYDITIQNTSRYTFVGTDALKEEEMASFPSNFYSRYITNARFDGFNETEMTEVNIGDEKLEFSTNDGRLHEIPFYTYDQLSDMGTAVNYIDGMNVWMRIDIGDIEDGNMHWDGNITMRYNSSSGPLIWQGYYVDTEITGPIVIDSDSNVSIQYMLLVDEISSSTARVWLLLAKQAFTTQYDKKVGLLGTDWNEDGVTDKLFYLPHSSYLPAEYQVDGNVYEANDYYVAWFSFSEPGEFPYFGNAKTFIDTQYGAGNLIELPNPELSYYAYQADYNAPTAGQYFRMSTSTVTYYPSTAWTDYGSRLSVENHIFNAQSPEVRNMVSLTVFNVVCGNGAIDEGETVENCPRDFGYRPLEDALK